MAEGSFVEWQNLGPLEKAEYLLNSGYLADCSFIVGTGTDDVKTFTAHKWQLACASTVFDRMFNGKFEESKSSNEIRLTDVTPADFKHFLLYIYSNSKENLLLCPIKSLQSLIYLGNKYMIPSLTTGCINLIKSKLRTLPNYDLLKAFEFAHFIENGTLIDQSSKVIKGRVCKENVSSSNAQNNYNRNIVCTKCNYEVYCSCGKYAEYNIHGPVLSEQQLNGSVNQQNKKLAECVTNSSNFCELNFCSFYELLKMLNGSTLEIVRFRMIEEYAKVNTVIETGSSTLPESKNKDFNKEMLDKSLQLLNFQKMSLKEFHNGPGKSTLLDGNKKFELLTEICEANKLFQENDYYFKKFQECLSYYGLKL